MATKYAIDEYDNLIHIDFAENGMSCKASCLECGKPVVAKQGPSLDWFFAHSARTSTCPSNNESNLHLVAKLILSRQSSIASPPSNYGAEDIGPRLITIASLKIEKAVGLLVPDVLAKRSDGTVFAIEFAVTSFCNPDKIRRLFSLGLSVLEIDLSSFDHDNFDIDELRLAICSDQNNRKWLLPNEYLLEASKQAQTASCDQQPEEESRTDVEPTIQDLTDNSLIERIETEYVPVIIRRLPHGNYAVRHSYNDSIRSVVQPICSGTPGARWHKHYNNWLIPADRITSVRLSLLKAFGHTPSAPSNT